MANLENLILRDTRANQPAAGVPGRLYFVTDETVLERDNGASWEDVSAAGGVAGIPLSGWVSAGETWTYASADDPTFTFTIAADVTAKYQAGMRIKLTQTTPKYFIITKVAEAGGTTTITVFGGTDYDLANAAITNPHYSPVKAPFGFPMDPAKWTVTFTDTAQRTQATPANGTWYNIGTSTLSIPIGAWNVYYQVIVQADDASTAAWLVYTTLSTANNSETNKDFSRLFYHATVNVGFIGPAVVANPLVLTSKTSYFLNAKVGIANLDNMYFRGDIGTTIIRATCAYL